MNLMIERLSETGFPPVTTRRCRELRSTLYRYIWRVSASQQVRLVALTVMLFPLSMAPLELQRRIVNGALGEADPERLLGFGAIYLAVLVAQGALKFTVNTYQGVVGEGIMRVLRLRVGDGRGTRSDGTNTSIAAAEVEHVGAFAGEAIAFPLLQIGVVVSTLGYLFWLEPLMAVVALVLTAPAVPISVAFQRRINVRVQYRARLLRRLGHSIADDDRYNGVVGRIYRTRVGIYLLKFAMKALNNFVHGLGPLVILLIGGWLVVEGRTEVGTIVAFLSGVTRLSDPARDLLNFYRRLSQTRAQFALLARALA